MPRFPKALIIACENYPKGEDIAQELKGTLDAARAFHAWLTSDKGLAAAGIYICCDVNLVGGHPANRMFPSTRPGVCDAITELIDSHRNQVSELYVFFSGHGLGYEQSPQQRGLDLLLTTDYRSRKRSGGACINIGELQAQMEIWLGGDDHYYFLDACRTVLKAGEIVPAGLGLALDPAVTGDPTTYALYSTKFGEVAAVNAKFPNALIEGLRGEGRAKTRVNREWWVRFDRLQKFVDSRVDTPTDSLKAGSRDGLIAKLDRPFETSLTVHVDGAKSDASFELKVSNGIEQTFPFSGPDFEKKLPPNEAGYGVAVLLGGRPLKHAGPSLDVSLDLFDPVELHFSAAPSTRQPELPPAPAVPPPPEPPAVSRSRVRDSIARHVPSENGGRVVHLSETLGPLAEQHTGLWLSMLGASRIIRDPGLYSKIGSFPLAHFEDLKSGECAVYVIAGLERQGEAQLAVSTAADVTWKPMEAVTGFDGVVHLRADVSPGPQLISLALRGQPPVTFASYALPNRVVLFAASQDRDGKLGVNQMLLPLYTLNSHPPAEGLRLIRQLVLQQDRFANREPLAPGERLDPLLALTSVFEMARRGGIENDRGKMAEAVANLERYFGELPDVAAVRRILDPAGTALPSGVPILRESLLRLPKLLEKLPLPAGLLDYGSMWTSWVGAVEGPIWKKDE